MKNIALDIAFLVLLAASIASESQHDLAEKNRGKRSLYNFANLVHCANENNERYTHYDLTLWGFLDFLPFLGFLDALGVNEYGCWCGPGTVGDDGDRRNPIYVDNIDRCCKIHDKCYDWVLEKYQYSQDKCDPKNYISGGHDFVCHEETKRITCTNEENSCLRSACECDKAAAKCFANSIYHEEYKRSSASSISSTFSFKTDEHLRICREERTEERCDSLPSNLNYFEECISANDIGDCQYFGDITKLDPTGAGPVTSKSYGIKAAGVKASQRIVDNDKVRLEAFLPCFQRIASNNGIHPALIGALASRLSSGGGSLSPTGYGVDGVAFGIMQCHPSSHINCEFFGAKSCDHIEMMVEVLLVDYILQVRAKFPQWSKEKVLQGAVAAYNFGIENVQTWAKLDVGSHNNDFSNDVIARAQHLINTHGWKCQGNPSPRAYLPTGVSPAHNRCKDMAERGDCEFYKVCVDDVKQCPSPSYSIDYGYKYCRRFDDYYHLFTAEGKIWVDEVRKCLMKHLLPYVKSPNIASCNQIKNIAFDSHVHCYIGSGPSFCNIMYRHGNWDALWEVYQLRDFLSLSAIKQVEITIAKCGYHLVNNLLPPQQVASEQDISSECLTYAQNGDCKFYECFEQRFPCAKHFLHSHVMEFELHYCMKYEQMYTTGYQIETWSKETQKCMMSKLVDLYEQPAINCSRIELMLYEERVRCMVESGFCFLEKQDEYFLDRAHDNKGYPVLLPDVYSKKPLSNGITRLTEEYYDALSYVRLQLGDAYYECHGQSLYTMKFNPTYGFNMKVRNEL